ncbi:MAG: signal peptide peptidase SppA [Myxococcales bacterium]|nr:signal peptide peptidase SppA [Myxococcales bacterium]
MPLPSRLPVLPVALGLLAAVRGLCVGHALAAETASPSTERPDLPFKSLAGEDGVHVLFQNPALMNYDRDAGYAAYYRTTALQGGLSAFTLATTGDGLGLGVGYRQFVDSTGIDAGWWTLSTGASLRLAKGLALGSAVHWQLPDGGDNNFVSWDLGLAWRPVPFLGFAGRVLNVGNPAPDLGVSTEYGGGLAVRPWNDAVTAGLDWRAVAAPNSAMEQHAVGSLRIKPLRGVWLRTYADIPLLDRTATVVGAALELHLADMAVGLNGSAGLGDPTNPGVGGYIASIPGADQVFVPGKKVAEFSLDGPYPYNPRGTLLAPAPEGYLTLLRRLKSASEDPQIRGVLVRVRQVPFSFAQVEEVRKLLLDCRSARKSVVVYIDGEASNSAYMLASVADRVYLHPAGGINLVGLSAELQFFKGALDLVGVQAQYRKRAEYKSAPEQWTNTGSSDPAREEMDALLDDLSEQLQAAIVIGRGKSPEDVKSLIDQGPFTANEALANGLVDALMYPDEVEDELHVVFGRRALFLDDAYEESPDHSGWQPQRAIGVITVDGPISEGESSSGGFLSGGFTGSDTVVRALDQARNTSAIKAVVLRVDSPGGSAFASAEIWRAVGRLMDEHKPVVVSMGGYAASGGYYVATNATAIYAEPSTVTGSIGVYGGKYNVQGLFEKLHIETEIFDRGRNASMHSMSKPFDEVQLASLDRMIGDTYAQFTSKVAAGREMSDEAVEEVARGRVWSGTAASRHGLIDAFGGLYDAVERARREAGIDEDAPYTLVAFDPWGGGDGDVPTALIRAGIQRVAGSKPIWGGLPVELAEDLEPFWSLVMLRDTTVFAMMPYRLEIN